MLDATLPSGLLQEGTTGQAGRHFSTRHHFMLPPSPVQVCPFTAAISICEFYLLSSPRWLAMQIHWPFSFSQVSVKRPWRS
jgi:hypothetical protein